MHLIPLEMKHDAVLLFISVDTSITSELL